MKGHCSWLTPLKFQWEINIILYLLIKGTCAQLMAREKKRGGDLIGQEEEPIKRPSLDVYNEPDKGGERWEPF